jgi:hypothetical protein
MCLFAPIRSLALRAVTPRAGRPDMDPVLNRIWNPSVCLAGKGRVGSVLEPIIRWHILIMFRSLHVSYPDCHTVVYKLNYSAHCTMHCAPHCTALHCTALHCTALHLHYISTATGLYCRCLNSGGIYCITRSLGRSARLIQPNDPVRPPPNNNNAVHGDSGGRRTEEDEGGQLVF